MADTIGRYADAVEAILSLEVPEVPQPKSADGLMRCPLCTRTLITDDVSVDPAVDPQLTFAQAEKLGKFTLAQLIAFRQLVARSDLTFAEMLDRTAIHENERGRLGLFVDMIYYGIERDGYTHT